MLGPILDSEDLDQCRWNNLLDLSKLFLIYKFWHPDRNWHPDYFRRSDEGYQRDLLITRSHTEFTNEGYVVEPWTQVHGQWHVQPNQDCPSAERALLCHQNGTSRTLPCLHEISVNFKTIRLFTQYHINLSMPIEKGINRSMSWFRKWETTQWMTISHTKFPLTISLASIFCVFHEATLLSQRKHHLYNAAGEDNRDISHALQRWYGCNFGNIILSGRLLT